ncbi:MAG TPA: DEAD/DEAH box helicase [Verrucomicrobiae bacterium]|nr:DEAD/DEAH box helicase [Verrucomicrobiae bacterium]
MPLASQLNSAFDEGAIRRGRHLWESGAVRVKKADLYQVYGQVLGGSLYDVRLRLHDTELEAWCDCPYFASWGGCKHVWAFILECDRRGVPAEAQKKKVLDIMADPRPDPFEDDFEDEEEEEAIDDFRPGRGRSQAAPLVRFPEWQEQLSAVESRLNRLEFRPAARPAAMQVLYVVDIASTKSSGQVTLELHCRQMKKNGQWGVRKELRLTPEKAAQLPDPLDADLALAMWGGQDPYSYSYSYYYSSDSQSSFRKALPQRLAARLLPQMATAGRLYSRKPSSADFDKLEWDDGEPWTFRIEIRQGAREQWSITGVLARGDQRLPLAEPDLMLDGFLLHQGKIARFDAPGLFAWVAHLRDAKKIVFPDRERDLVMQRLLNSPILPPMDLDAALQFEERSAQPRLGLRLKQQKNPRGQVWHDGQLLFDYGRGWTADNSGKGFWFPDERVYLRRDPEAERTALETIQRLGFRPSNGPAGRWSVSTSSLPRVLRDLIASGWHVEAEGKAFRKPGAARVSVSSGIDWFEVEGAIDYEGESVSLPKLLAALRGGNNIVVLGDGSFGLLPEDWLQRFAPLAGLGSREGDNLRFRRNQAALLDALLAAQPDVRVDETFARIREQMRCFHGIETAPQPEGFVGQLREYQREGLGWMQFLRDFGFGGCLADDMGVGKTAQVLAVLEQRRSQGEGPSLVVAPKSVVFNWREEAARFTPKLRVLEHVGTDRDAESMTGYDLILTTYGTMMRDAEVLSRKQFDYVVLDEAQAVKNASTATAKAVRLLQGKHRLALSGTPVENHLGELWSLFEFLNPGMLGEAKVLNMSGGLARNPGEEARQLLAQALRPFILRRTKQQVARELPSKTEQTILCELEDQQRKQYDELRRHYRESLLRRVEQQGLGKSRMHVLEALLRLRQAACHPGLLDSKRVDEPSAKMDALLDQLDEVREEGHKALVFSQFTSLLAILRRRLDESGVRYEYLDGATRDRQTRVETFQTDPECGLFLISLKAGGLGLNLTAAEYVFLLDPWWNPAVEAQAVDRAHRIGQTRPVFAYRLIAKDTVEEKVLELQRSKRELADAILSEDKSLIRDLKKEDLELLLS